jgi:hypothetical protein
MFLVCCLSRWPRGPRRSWDRGLESRFGHRCLSLCLYVVLSYVGRGLCDKLIARPNESYHVSNKLKNPKKGGQGPAWAAEAKDDESFWYGTDHRNFSLGDLHLS